MNKKQTEKIMRYSGISSYFIFPTFLLLLGLNILTLITPLQSEFTIIAFLGFLFFVPFYIKLLRKSGLLWILEK